MSDVDALVMRLESIREVNPCTEFGPAARAKLDALTDAVLYLLRNCSE